MVVTRVIVFGKLFILCYLQPDGNCAAVCHVNAMTGSVQDDNSWDTYSWDTLREPTTVHATSIKVE
jgi:hypothetical protein